MGKKKSNRFVQKNKVKEKNLERKTGPNAVVLTRGTVSADIKQLKEEFQRMLEPHTLSKLEHTKRNSMKDFVAVSSQLDLTHVILFAQTAKGVFMQIGRLPRGPTVIFKLTSFVRANDVLKSMKKAYMNIKLFKNPPCVMTNLQINEGSNELKLTARMIIDMFPSISPETAEIWKIKRCCLFNYDAENEVFDLRHYAIRTTPVEVSKGVKKLLSNKIPDLGKFTDISEYMSKAGLLTDSEAEDDPDSRIAAPHKRLPKKSIKSSVRLSELGPRITCKIHKVLTGLFEGDTSYHSTLEITPEEKLKLEEERNTKKKLKEKRRKEQQKNVEAKLKLKEEHKKKCMSGTGHLMRDAPKLDTGNEADDEEDDREHYRQEVGEEPDPDFFQEKRKRSSDENDDFPKKKFKSDGFKGNNSKFHKKKQNNDEFSPSKFNNKNKNKNKKFEHKDDFKNTSFKKNKMKKKGNFRRK